MRSSQKLASLLLRINNAICREGDMHSESTQVHTVVSLLLSRRVCTVKCVCPALEMVANKEEQGGVVHFLVAEGDATCHKLKTFWNTVRRNHPFACKHPPHTANLVRDKLQRFGWETLLHPPYSPDFHLVTSTRGHRFHSDEEVQEWVRLWIHQRPISFYKTEIDCLISQWDTCINTSGNYF